MLCKHMVAITILPNTLGWYSAVADLHSKILDARTPGVQILLISCSFRENLAKLYVGAPLPQSLSPLLGEILDPPLLRYLCNALKSFFSMNQECCLLLSVIEVFLSTTVRVQGGCHQIWFQCVRRVTKKNSFVCSVIKFTAKTTLTEHSGVMCTARPARIHIISDNVLCIAYHLKTIFNKMSMTPITCRNPVK